MISFNKIYKENKKEIKNQNEETPSQNCEGVVAILKPQTLKEDWKIVSEIGIDFWKFFKDGSCFNLPMFTEPPEPVAVKRVCSELNLTITPGTTTNLAFVPFIDKNNFYINGQLTPLTTITATNCFSTYKVVAATIRIKQVGIMSVSDGYGTIIDAVIAPPTDFFYLHNNFLNIQTGPYKKLTLVDGRKGIKASFVGSTLYPPLEDSNNQIEQSSYAVLGNLLSSETRDFYLPAFTTFIVPYRDMVFNTSHGSAYPSNPNTEMVLPYDIVSVQNTGASAANLGFNFKRPYGEMLYVKISPPSINVTIKIYCDFIIEGKTLPEFSSNMPQVTPPMFYPFEELRNSLCNVICPLMIDNSPKTAAAMLKKKFYPNITIDKGKIKIDNSDKSSISRDTIKIDNNFDTKSKKRDKNKEKLEKIRKEQKEKFKNFEELTKGLKYEDLEPEVEKEIEQRKDKEKKEEGYYLTEECDPMYDDGDLNLEKIFNLKEDQDSNENSEESEEEKNFKNEIRNIKKETFDKLNSNIPLNERREKILDIKALNLLEKEKMSTIKDFFKSELLNRVEKFVKNNDERKKFGKKFLEVALQEESEEEKDKGDLKEEKPIGYCMMEDKEFKRDITAKTNVVVSKKKKLPKVLEDASRFLGFPVSALHNTPLTNRLFRDASTPWPEISYQYFPIVDEEGNPDYGICCLKKGLAKNVKKVTFKVPDVNGQMKKLSLGYNPDTFTKPDEFYDALNSIIAFLYSYAFHYVPEEPYTIELFSSYKLQDISYMYAMFMCLYGAPSGGFYTGAFKCEAGGKYEVLKLDAEALGVKLKIAKPDTPLMVLSSDAVDGDFINIVAGVVPDFQQGSMISTSDLKIATIYGLLPFSTRTIRKTPYSEYSAEDTELVMKELASDARVYIAISNIKKAAKFQDYLDNGIRKWKTYNRADPANFTCYIVNKGKYVTANDFYKNRKDILDNDNGWSYVYADTLFVEEPKFRADLRSEKFNPSIKLTEENKTELDLKNILINDVSKETLAKLEDRLKIKFKNQDPDFEPENNLFKGNDGGQKEGIKNKIIDNLAEFSKVLLNFEQFLIDYKPKRGEPNKKIFNSSKAGSALSLIDKENKISKNAPTETDKNVKYFEDLCEKVSPVAPIYLLQIVDEENYRNIVDPNTKILNKILEYLIDFNNNENEEIEAKNQYSESKHKTFTNKNFIKVAKNINEIKKKRKLDNEDEKEDKKKISSYGQKIDNYKEIDFELDKD